MIHAGEVTPGRRGKAVERTKAVKTLCRSNKAAGQERVRCVARNHYGRGEKHRSFLQKGKPLNCCSSPAARRLGTATRMNASLSRRLSAFFGSAPDQDPKAAKYAVLTPGHAGFPNRAKRSDGSDSAPIRNARVSPCEPLCARLGAGVACVPAEAC